MSTWGKRGVPTHTRIRVLERDEWQCQLGYDGCTYHATEVDHIIGVAALGVDRAQANDADGLQSVCAACHARKTEAQRMTAWRAHQQHRHERRHLPVSKHPGAM